MKLDREISIKKIMKEVKMAKKKKDLLQKLQPATVLR